MELIDKDALVAEIERKKEYAQTLGDNAINSSMQQFYDGMKQGCVEILSFLDTLEVKEVDLKEEIDNYVKRNGYDGLDSIEEIKYIANYFAKWQKEHLWKPADGDDLPEIDREVIALLDNGKVGYIGYAHRPPEYWDGKDIDTAKVTRYYPQRYDKGGWNIPDVKYWLDLDLPNKNE